MKKTASLTVLMAVVFLSSSLAIAAGDLNNSAWQLSEKGKKDATDTLLFINGQFTSSECVPYGFITGSYTSSRQGDKLVWSSLQTNETNEKMEWKGEANGTGMKGSFTHVSRDGKSSTTEWTARKNEAN